jgi:hypothetical protein
LGVTVTAKLNVAVCPTGITSGGCRRNAVLFGCSGELPPDTGFTVAVEVFGPALAVSVAEVNKSALSKLIVTSDVASVVCPLFCTVNVPELTVLPGMAAVVIGVVGVITIAADGGVGVGVT